MKTKWLYGVICIVFLALVFNMFLFRKDAKKLRKASKKILKVQFPPPPAAMIGQSPMHPKTNTPYPIKNNKNFVVIIPSYNNAKWYERNLRSVFEQNYNNYRVIYIDDVSKDGTADLVENYVKKCNQEHRFKLIRNPERRGALHNLYHAIHGCRDDEIVVTLDGDDWFSHEYVMMKLNGYYANPNVWMTYGQYMEYPDFNRGMCAPIYLERFKEKEGFRAYDWVASHLRTFYAGLFKKIKLKDMFYQGTFFKMGWDYTFMLPMLEMCDDKFMYVSEITYMYNRLNPISDDRVNLHLQAQSAIYVRFMKPYKKLNEAPYVTKLNSNTKKSDIIIFSDNNPLQLYACIESIKKKVTNYSDFFVLYSSDKKNENSYKAVFKDFSDLIYISAKKNYKTNLLNLLSKMSMADYVLFGCDKNIVTSEIDLSKSISKMNQTKAHGFYFSLGNNICSERKMPNLIAEENNILAWQYRYGENDWRGENYLNLTLYSKNEIVKSLEKFRFKNYSDIAKKLKSHVNDEKVGLYYDRSKVVSVNIDKSNLENFKKSLKIDIEDLANIENKRANINYLPKFVNR